MARDHTSIRLLPAVKEAATKAATSDGRTLSQWIERVIMERLRADGYLPPGAAE